MRGRLKAFIERENSALWLDLMLLTLLVGLLYLTFLGSRPLFPPDEARYADIPREMLANNDFITPHLNFIKYFEKPPLFYWLQAGAIQLFGFNDWAMRSVNAFAGIFTILVTFLTTVALYGRRIAWYASIVLTFSLLFFAMSNVVTLDMTLTLFLTSALFCFLLGSQEHQQARRHYYMWGLYTFAALAMMTKGLIGLLFPGLIIGLWVLLLNKWKDLRTYCIPTGILIVAVIAAPWHILVQLKNPEFFNFYFIEQHFARYFTDYAGREQSLWFLPAVLLVGFFPWTGFLFQAIRFNLPTHWKMRTQHPISVFLIIYVASIYVVFQFSHSLLVPYLLPLFPPLAILTGRYLVEAQQDSSLQKGLRMGFYVLIGLTFLLGLGLLFAVFQENYDELLPLKMYYFFPSLFLVLTSLVLFFQRKPFVFNRMLLTTLFGVGMTCLTLIFCATAYNQKSVKSLALTINDIAKPTDQIVLYRYYCHDLPLYTKRRIVLANNKKGELLFGMKHQDMKDWYWDENEFWKKWSASHEKIYAVMKHKDFRKATAKSKSPLYVISQTRDFVLVTNHEGSA